MKARIITALLALIAWVDELIAGQNAWENDPDLIDAVNRAEQKLAER